MDLRHETQLARALPYPSARPLGDGEHYHLEYFHNVCAPEFALFYELPVWENIILQYVLAEPALHHAALAIGCLSRVRYHPGLNQPSSPMPFAIQQYGLAIQALHRRLDTNVQSLELAVLASVVFSVLEFLLGLDNQVEVHIQAGNAMLESLYEKQNPVYKTGSYGNDAECIKKSEYTNNSLLGNAIFQLTAQVNLFRSFQRSKIAWPPSAML